MPKYRKDIPSFISIGVSNVDEAARWVLDRNEIEYIDWRNPPVVHVIPVNFWVGKWGIYNNPVFVSKELMKYTSLGIAEYFETVCPPEKRLFPADADQKKEMLDFVNWSMTNVAGPTSQFGYYYLLPNPRLTKPMLNYGSHWWEKCIVNTSYWALKIILRKSLKITTAEAALDGVRSAFDTIEKRLSDGRKYLMGDDFTFADIMFAANANPMILPVEFGGTTTTPEAVPADYRKAVEELRETTAGKFVSRLYSENRPPRKMPSST